MLIGSGLPEPECGSVCAVPFLTRGKYVAGTVQMTPGCEVKRGSHAVTWAKAFGYPLSQHRRPFGDAARFNHCRQLDKMPFVDLHNKSLYRV